MVDARSKLRDQKIAELKRRIAEGTYETPEKLEAAVERLLEAHEAELLGGENPPVRTKRIK